MIKDKLKGSPEANDGGLDDLTRIERAWCKDMNDYEDVSKL